MSRVMLGSLALALHGGIGGYGRFTGMRGPSADTPHPFCLSPSQFSASSVRAPVVCYTLNANLNLRDLEYTP